MLDGHVPWATIGWLIAWKMPKATPRRTPCSSHGRDEVQRLPCLDRLRLQDLSMLACSFSLFMVLSWMPERKFMVHELNLVLGAGNAQNM